MSMLARGQWTLLNLLHRRSGLAAGCGGPSGPSQRRAGTMLAVADAAVEDLDELRERGLVAGRWVGWVDSVAGQTVHRFAELRRSPRLDAVELDLTEAGVRWVEHDPHNRVLVAAADDGRGSCGLAAAVARHGLDLDAVVGCQAAGLVDVVDVVFGSARPVPPVAAELRRAIRDRPHGGAVWLELTNRGARLLFP